VGFYSLSFIRFCLSFAVLLIPATLMGGTLPVLLKFFARRRERLGWNVGALYALNTFGAVVGTLSAGFFLILLVGVREAAYLAGGVNLLIAGAVYLVYLRSGKDRGSEGVATTEDAEPGREGAEPFSPRLARLALWAVGLSGFCALALEVFWTRALVFFLDNSTHAFTTILTAFLLGIALGSTLIAKFVDTRKRLFGWLGVIEILIGLSAVAAIPILNHSTPVIQSLMRASLDSMLHWRWMGMRFLTTLSVMLVPTILIGATFPLVTKIYTRNVERVGTALGNVYSVNTIGGVFGSLIAGFFLIPAIGMQKGIILVSGINVLIGAVLVLYEPVASRRSRVATAVASLLVFSGAGTFYLTSGGLALTSYTERIEAAEVLSYEEGIGATVKVFLNEFGERLISINGFPVAGEPLGLQDAQKPLAHLPLLLSDAPNPKVNLIGFGAGGASWGVMQYDVEEVDCVELVPGVINAAHWFPSVNHGVVDDPKFNVIIGDGRNYALVSDEKYDVISIDATSPKMAGNGSLYALEFYELLKDRLKENGIVVQWFPLHLLSDAEVRMTAKTMLEVFPHTSLWLTPLRQHSILVATPGELKIDVRSLVDRMERVGFQDEFGDLHVNDVVDLLSWFAMGEEALAEYVGDVRINSDNHPYLEFTPAMAYFVADLYKAQNIENIRDYRVSIAPFLTNLGETGAEAEAFAERVRLRYEATQQSLKGDVLLTLGRQTEAIMEYNMALLIDPGDKNWMNPVWRDNRPSR
jgi:spermidine synthase